MKRSRRNDMHLLHESALLQTRRALFGKAAVGLGTAALASLLTKDGLAENSLPTTRIGGLPELPHFAPKAKRVIYLFQNGGPTHVELFDYKPKLTEVHGQPVPAEYFAGNRF